MAKEGKKEVATAAFEKMNKRQQLALLAAVGLKAGPNVSLVYAIDKFRRDKIREVLLYLLFLILFTVSALVQRDVTNSHYYTQTVKNAILNENFPGVTWFKTFKDVSMDGDFWDYMTKVIPKYLYPEEWYNGQPFSTDELNYVLHVNRLVQAPRLRQLRVNKQDCAVPPRLRKILSVCYPSFAPENENKTAITGWPPGEILEYRTDQQLQTSRYSNGLLPYGGGGFALDIPLYFNKSQSLEFFTYLKANKWTDLHTRAVFFDFVLYNPDNGLYLSVRLLFEFLPYGQVRPSSQFRAMRLGFSTLKDYAAVLLDAIVYLFVLFYMVGDCRKLIAMGRGYWTHFWHWFNWVNYMFFAITLVHKLNFLLPALRYINSDGDLDIQQASLDFESLGWMYYQSVNWQAFNNILVWLKAFSFLKFLSAGVANLAYTIALAGKDCGLFLVIFIMVIFAYAQAFHISFGTDIEEYKTLLDAVFGLFKTLLGDFDFEAIKLINPYLGPLLFITFEVVCYFVFLNMFLAILNKSYSDVLDKGVDDPMAVEFRATMSRYLGRVRDVVFFWRRNDDLDRFKEEEDGEEEGGEEKEADNTLDGEALGIMLNTIQELSSTVRGLNDKIDNISRVQALTGASGKLQKLSTAGESRSQTANGGAHSLGKVDSLSGTTSAIMSPKGKGPGSPGAGGGYGTEVPVRAGPSLSTYGADAAKKGAPPPLPPATVSGTVLPPGWERLTDEGGEVYFHNTSSGTTQWEPPVVVAPPHPRAAGVGGGGGVSWEGGSDEDQDAATPRL